MSRTYEDIAYPWGPTLDTFAELKIDEHVLRTSIINILMTRKKERVMLPEFGSDVQDIVFDPNDEASVVSLEETIRDAFRRWDDRLDFQAITAERDGHLLKIRIQFKNIKDPLEVAVNAVEIKLLPSE